MSWPKQRNNDDRPIRSWEEVDQQLQESRAEIDRLRLAIRRLAEQDATLSVCDGEVTVTMDATLTDAERKAIERLIEDYEQDGEPASDGVVATLRGLVERLK